MDLILYHRKTQCAFLISSYNLHCNAYYCVQLQPDWPNAFIGCMSCQAICPANKPFLSNILEGDSFAEEETRKILARIPLTYT